ncbi:MAG TPA: glycosyltransferase family 25 protein [Candidatus Saccharimonadales bacterium]|nr:glycosyltransferase family 25 protein [Candidatus Saccharimonadales bacterium]
MNSDLSIVVISFPGSARRERVSSNLNSLSIPWTFFDAHREPKNNLPQYNEVNSVRFWGRGLSKSEIGCAASHIDIIAEMAKSQDEKWILVVEDDVVLDPGFDYRALVDICKIGGIGYLRLHARHLARSRHVMWLGQRELVRFKKAPMGTQAYLISSSKARSFVNQVKTIDRPIDWEMDRFWANGLHNYALFPFPCLELVLTSSIKKEPESSKKRTAYDKAVWFAWKSKESLCRSLMDIYLRYQDRNIRRALEGKTTGF